MVAVLFALRWFCLFLRIIAAAMLMACCCVRSVYRLVMLVMVTPFAVVDRFSGDEKCPGPTDTLGRTAMLKGGY